MSRLVVATLLTLFAATALAFVACRCLRSRFSSGIAAVAMYAGLWLAFARLYPLAILPTHEGTFFAVLVLCAVCNVALVVFLSSRCGKIDLLASGWTVPRYAAPWLWAVVPGVVSVLFVDVVFGVRPVVASASLTAVFSILVLLPATTEEMVFRGLLWRQFTQLRIGTPLTLVGQAFIFSIVHYRGGTLQAEIVGGLELFVLGVFCGLARHRSRSLLPCAVGHWLYDMLIIGLHSNAV